MKIKWGIIGCGRLAMNRIIPAMKMSHKTELVAVYHPDLKRARERAKQVGVPRYYSDLKDFARDKEIEAVFIGSPNAFHCIQTIHMANSGKHIFCEKPMAVTSSDCQKMIEACTKNNVRLMIGFCYRLHGAQEKAKDMIRKGVIGEPQMMKIHFGIKYTPGNDPWRCDRRLSGGGPLMDLGVHLVDMVRFMLDDEIRTVSALLKPLKGKLRTDNSAISILEMKSGRWATIECSFDYSIPNSYIVHGTKGYISARGTMSQVPEGKLELCREDAKGIKYEVLGFSLKNFFRKEIDDFNNAIITGRNPFATGRDGLISIQWVEAVYESMRIGRRINI